jgi:hypothetical protein
MLADQHYSLPQGEAFVRPILCRLIECGNPTFLLVMDGTTRKERKLTQF